MDDEKCYDREKLYREIWLEPMTKVSKRYDISDVGLSKICKKLNIPRPHAGYWTQKEVGKAPPIPPLPEFSAAPKLFINRLKKEDEPILATEAFIEAEKMIRLGSSPDMAVLIPKEIQNLHPFISNTINQFKKKYKSTDYQMREYNRIKTTGTNTFEINIGLESLTRVKHLLQALCDAFTKRGFLITSHTGYGDFACIKIMGIQIGFTIFETSVKVPVSPETLKKHYYYKDYDYKPTGILKLELKDAPYNMDYRKSWTDNKSGKLEEKLNDVIKGLITAAAWKKENDAKRILRDQEYEIKRNKRKEIEELNRIDDKRIEILESSYKKWTYHKELKKYIEIIISKYKLENGEPEGDFKDWIDWANNYLEKIDPLNAEYPIYDIEK